MAYEDLTIAAMERLRKAKRPALALTSGGNTPKAFMPDIFFACLNEDLRIFWTLTDERCVPHSNDASNFGMLKRLSQDYSEFLIPLYCKDNPSHLDDKKFACYPLAILGYAEDGHTMSIFADSSYCQQATDLAANEEVFFGHYAMNEEFPRVTYGFSFLKRFEEIFLIVSSKEKFDFLAQAIENNQTHLPVVALMQKFRSRIRLFAYDRELFLWHRA